MGGIARGHTLPESLLDLHARQRWLVLVVAEVCARGYDTSEVGDRGAGSEAWTVGRPAACAAVGVEAEKK